MRDRKTRKRSKKKKRPHHQQRFQLTKIHTSVILTMENIISITDSEVVCEDCISALNEGDFFY